MRDGRNRDAVTSRLSRRETAAAEHSETNRQIVHMAMGGFALLLRWLAWWQAIALAAGAVAFNVFALPRIARGLFRPGDQARALHGIVLYPVAVLLLLLAFPARPDIVAAAWGILAFGDGSATLAGRALAGPRWSWNREKTFAGSATFVIVGGAGGVFLAWWCRAAVQPSPDLAFTIAAPLAAALVAAAVETIPVRLDDNLSVAISAGAVLWVASLMAHGSAAARVGARCKRRGRVGGVSRANRLTFWSTSRRAHRNRHLRRARMARVGVAAGRVFIGGHHVADGMAAQDAPRHRGGARRPAWRGQCDRQHRRCGDRRNARADRA
jgi:phytol kinase